MDFCTRGIWSPDAERKTPEATRARIHWRGLSVGEMQAANERTSTRHKGVRETRGMEYAAEICALSVEKIENVSIAGVPVVYPDKMPERRAFWLAFPSFALMDELASTIIRGQTVSEAELRD